MNKRENVRHYLQLLEVFTIREIKSHYKASILGPLWIIISPLVTAFLLNFIFGKFIKIDTGEIPYFLFLLSGLIFWNFFQQGLNLAKDSLVWNRELVVKTAFPKDTLPISYVLSKIPDFFINLAILLFFYIINGYNFTFLFFLMILLLLPLFLFSAGLALIISLTNAVFRDFGRIFEFVLMVFFYVTPIVYPDSFIPSNYKIILSVNPLSLLIVFTRDLLFKNQIRMELFFSSLTMSFLIFAFGLFLFKQFRKKITDLI